MAGLFQVKCLSQTFHYAIMYLANRPFCSDKSWKICWFPLLKTPTPFCIVYHDTVYLHRKNLTWAHVTRGVFMKGEMGTKHCGDDYIFDKFLGRTFTKYMTFKTHRVPHNAPIRIINTPRTTWKPFSSSFPMDMTQAPLITPLLRKTFIFSQFYIS